MAVIDKSDWKSIKIAESIKNRMDYLKGRQSYGEFLDNVLGFLEMTGIDPKYNQLPPAVTIVKAIKDEIAPVFRRMEDNIRIMRNIESTKLDPMVHAIKSILSGKGNNEDIITRDEAISLIAINEKLEEELKIERENNVILKKSTVKSTKLDEIINTLNELLADRTIGLTRDFREQLVEKIRTIAYDN